MKNSKQTDIQTLALPSLPLPLASTYLILNGISIKEEQMAWNEMAGLTRSSWTWRERESTTFRVFSLSSVFGGTLPFVRNPFHRFLRLFLLVRACPASLRCWLTAFSSIFSWVELFLFCSRKKNILIISQTVLARLVYKNVRERTSVVVCVFKLCRWQLPVRRRERSQINGHKYTHEKRKIENFSTANGVGSMDSSIEWLIESNYFCAEQKKRNFSKLLPLCSVFGVCRKRKRREREKGSEGGETKKHRKIVRRHLHVLRIHVWLFAPKFSPHNGISTNLSNFVFCWVLAARTPPSSLHGCRNF